MKNSHVNTVIGLALGAAITAHAQWTNQLLNSSAVTNAAGQIIVKHDGGGYWANDPIYAPDKVFDGNTGTFYNTADIQQVGWVGFEMETPKLITRVRYFGRTNFASRVTGVRIQGANQSSFADAVTLHTLNPPTNWVGNAWRDETFLTHAAMQSFKYVRFIALPGTYGGNLAEIQFYGTDPTGGMMGAPAAPTLTFEDSINWRMNLCWTEDPLSTFLYEIERKIAHEDDFSPLATVGTAAGERSFCDTSLLLYRDAEYRIRAVNPDGVSPWVTRTATARNAARGQVIGTPGSWAPDMAKDHVFDGNVTTFFNSPDGTASSAWVGLDFGSEQQIIGLRFVPRRNGTAPSRMDGGWFEIADNPAFANPTLIYTQSGVPSINAVTQTSFSPPLSARYARYCGPVNSYANIAEMEFVLPDQPPLPPNNLTITPTDFTNAHAILTWALHDVGALISSPLVWRATSPGGPYTLMTTDGIAGTEWTDTTVSPSIRYYYKVSALLDDPLGGDPLKGAMSDRLSYIPGTSWLERAPNAPTHIRPGMTLLGTHYPIYNNDPIYAVSTMFDGNAGTFPNPAQDFPGIAVGVDLGKAYGIQFMRHVGRAGSTGGGTIPLVTRLEGAELRGSNSANYTNTFTRLATFAGVRSDQHVNQPTVDANLFRYVFVQRPDTNAFWGNIAELELYGWDPDALNSNFKAPHTVSISIQQGGVCLDWEQGTQQDFYRIERQVGASVQVGANVLVSPYAWQEIATTQAPPFIDTTPPVGQRTYYRVVAVRGTPPNEEVGYSDPYDIAAYIPGGGTGLTASYFTSYRLPYNPSEKLAGTFTEGAPDWGLAHTTPVRPEVPASAEYFRIAYTGKIIIPFNGDYTFYVTSDDGSALWINGTCVINRWFTGGVTTHTATLPLTAGEHDIRLDYFQDVGVSYKTLKLEWGGAVDRCVIPAAQLIPAPLPAGEGVFTQTGPWSGRTFGGGRLGFSTMNPDGSITLGHAEGDFWQNEERYHYIWQTIHGDFIFEAKADMDIDPLRKSGKAHLMIRNDLPGGAPFFALSAGSAPVTGKFNVKQRLTQGASITDALPAWTGPYLNPVHLQVKRSGGVFTLSYRDPSSAFWVPLHTFADTGVFAKDLYVGMAVSAPTSTSAKMFQTVDFSDITLRRLNIGTMLMVR